MNEIIDITMPGSKSLTHRYLICAALTEGESVIRNGLESDDIDITIKALEICGASITREEHGTYRVRGGLNNRAASLKRDKPHIPAVNRPYAAKREQYLSQQASARVQQKTPPLRLDMGNSGTSSRLLTAVLSAGHGQFVLQGGPGMQRRPMSELVDALRVLGTEIDYLGTPGVLPLRIKARGFPAAGADFRIGINCSRSSQYMSAMLMAAPLRSRKKQANTVQGNCGAITLNPLWGVRSAKQMPSDSNLTIELDFSRLSYGEKLRPVSWSYVELTMQAMSHFGITPGIEVRGRDGEWTSRDWLTEHTKGVQPPGGIRFIVPIAGYKPAEVDVEADWSSASYFLAAGAIGPRPVRVRGLNLTSLQGDRLILSILRLMGARVEVSGHDVTVYPSKLRGVDLNMDFCPDIVPTVLALGAHAEGTTVLRDINHLQYKESDRVVAMAQELRKAGCVLLALPGDKNGGLAISSPGNSPHKPENGLPFRTHNDHRIAMALCLLGLPGTKRNAASEKSCANTGSASVGSDSPGFTVELDNPACVSKSFPGFWKLWRKICA